MSALRHQRNTNTNSVTTRGNILKIQITIYKRVSRRKKLGNVMPVMLTNCLSVFDHFVGLALKELKMRLNFLRKNRNFP